MIAMEGSLTLFVFLFFTLILVPGAMSGYFVFTNRCQEVIYPGVLTAPNKPTFPTTGFELQPGAFAHYMGVPPDWSGRVWARRRRSTDASGRFSCASGDCGTGRVECGGAAGGAPPCTLAEFTLHGDGATDFYDISNVDGFNLPLQVIPSGTPASCATVTCAGDINAACPPELAAKAADGSTVGCRSACLAFNTDEFCCRGEFGTPDRCKPSSYSMFFKERCPQAYSYAYDDRSSTFTCPDATYHVIFCP